MSRPAACAIVCALSVVALGSALPAAALVVHSSNPETQEKPPARDPGWSNVGRRASTSAVYLGNGWVITARHSGIGPVLFDGVSYPPVAGSGVVLRGPGPKPEADLRMFRVDPAPDLPALKTLRKPARFGTRVLYVAWGQGRGEPARRGEVEGFLWRPGLVRRWGTNRIYAVNIDVAGPHTITRCFQTDFSRHGTRHEAQGATGDSGGAVFVRREGAWRLAGILLSIGNSSDQEQGLALFGNITNSADLTFYRKQIRAVMAGEWTAPPVRTAPPDSGSEPKSEAKPDAKPAAEFEPPPAPGDTPR